MFVKLSFHLNFSISHNVKLSFHLFFFFFNLLGWSFHLNSSIPYKSPVQRFMRIVQPSTHLPQHEGPLKANNCACHAFQLEFHLPHDRLSHRKLPLLGHTLLTHPTNALLSLRFLLDLYKICSYLYPVCPPLLSTMKITAYNFPH